jgi:hypothetical protein
MTDATDVIVGELRALILESAPEPERARAVLDCSADEALDAVIPFSSLIVLGTIVAVEDHFHVRVTKTVWQQVNEGAPTLRRLACVVQTLRAEAEATAGP